MSESDTSLVPYEATYTAVEMVRPLVDPQSAAEAMRQYEALKAAIQLPSDIHTETRNAKDEKGAWVKKEVKYLKKSYWRRIARCFGLTVELVSQDRGFDEAGNLFYSVLYRAVAPNGQSMVGDGYCSRAEGGHTSWPEHSIRATAHTRAKNRAISDLVGGGEVSAEEMPGGDAYIAGEAERKALPAPAQTRPAPAPASPKATVKPTPAATTPPTSNGTTATNEAFDALRERARQAGITDDDWPLVCQEHAGTDDPARMLPPGKRNLVRYIEALEAQQATGDTEVTSADFPAPENDYDLSRLPTGAVRP